MSIAIHLTEFWKGYWVGAIGTAIGGPIVGWARRHAVAFYRKEIA